jgi:hypothetical protein
LKDTGKLHPRCRHGFPAAKLAGLEQTGEETYACLEVRNYRGTDQDSPLQVSFLSDVQLPRYVRRHTSGGEKTWELKALHTDPTAIDALLARLESYDVYDFADLGDSEHEDFFRESRYLQYKIGHEHPQHHQTEYFTKG